MTEIKNEQVGEDKKSKSEQLGDIGWGVLLLMLEIILQGVSNLPRGVPLSLFGSTIFLIFYVVQKRGKKYRWLYLIPTVAVLGLAFYFLPLFLAAALTAIVMTVISPAVVTLMAEKWRSIYLLRPGIVAGVWALLAILAVLAYTNPPMVQKAMMKFKQTKEHVFVLLAQFESESDQAGRSFTASLYQELKDRTEKPVEVPVADTAFSFAIVIKQMAEVQDEQKLKEEAKGRKADLGVLGKYREYEQDGKRKTVVKKLRAIIFNQKIAQVFESAQPFDELYEFSVQPEDTITIVEEVSDVIEYVLGVAVNYELVRKALEAEGYRRKVFLVEINERYEKLAVRLGDVSLGEFHRGNGFYRAASETSTPSIDLFKAASQAYRKSITLFQQAHGPLKREPSRTYLNWAITLKKMFEISDVKAYADTVAWVYKEVCARYPSYEAYRDRTQFLLKQLGEMFVTKACPLKEFATMCDEFVECGTRLQGLIVTDMRRPPAEKQNEIGSIGEEIEMVRTYKREYGT
jgi:hypothetical protein